MSQGKTTRKYKPRKHVSDQEIADALVKAAGVYYAAAMTLGIHRKTIEARIKKSEALKETAAQAVEQNCDIGEARLIEALREGEPWAIKEYLHSKARNRGYGFQRLDITTQGEKIEPVQFYLPDNGRKVKG